MYSLVVMVILGEEETGDKIGYRDKFLIAATIILFIYFYMLHQNVKSFA